MDRLSGLPDEVIFHILSFLPGSKKLVQTSVLAKAWRFHWSRVPGFGFARPQQMIINENNSNTCFHIGPATSDDELESWIATVFARNIRYLLIDLKYRLTLPPCLFTSETLLYLRIHDCGSIPEGGYYSLGCEDSLSFIPHFPVLKKLQLVNVRCDCDYSLCDLLNGCPVLEEFTIKRMNMGVCVLDSKTDTITRLRMDLRNSHTLLLSIPSLRYLRLRVRISRRRHIRPWASIRAWALPLLIEADIDLMAASKFHSPRKLTVFLGELYNVNRLTLSTRQLIDIPTTYFSDWDVEFHNLTELNLRTDWHFITCFLKNANNLRLLTILHTVDHSTQHWMEPKQVPACLLSHLETLNLINFEWFTQHEFDMLEYILKNAKVLKRTEIICTRPLDFNVKLEAIKKFTMFEIGSSTCELILNLDDA